MFGGESEWPLQRRAGFASFKKKSPTLKDQSGGRDDTNRRIPHGVDSGRAQGDGRSGAD